jgi:hypothetical protein
MSATTVKCMKKDTKYFVLSINLGGKDASRALAKSSLDMEHAIADISDLNEEETKTLNDWVKFCNIFVI